MNEILKKLNSLFDLMDEIDALSMKETGKPSSFPISKDAQDLKEFIQRNAE